MNSAAVRIRAFFLNKTVLWILFIANLLGTIYGYIWYGSQLQYTADHKPLWLLVFVPDSPTASLLFTVSIFFLLIKPYWTKGLGIRMLIEALAAVTSIKYGLWAVTMIFAGAYQGNILNWQDYMLVASHLAMAVEALLYIRYFTCGTGMIMIAAMWTLLNDVVDYTYTVFPWLPSELDNDIISVQNFTFLLTLLCSVIVYTFVRRAGRR